MKRETKYFLYLFFSGITFFVTFMICSLCSYFVGKEYGIIMAILIVGLLLLFSKEKKRGGSLND